MNSEHKVFFYEAFEEERGALEKFNGGSIPAGYDWKTIQETDHKYPPAPIISVRTQSQIPPEWKNSLQAVLTRSTGYDHLTAYRREQRADNILMGYLPLYCNRAVAEQAMLFWTALLRRLPLQLKQFAQFNRDGITGGECARRKLAVFGVGNIGYQVVRIGRGLDMQVVGVDVIAKHRDVYYVSPEAALEQAGIIVCSMDLNSDNYAYFNYNLLRQARPGVIFVNIARGELSPPEDLLRLLEEQRLAGVGLDVYPDEKILGPALRGDLPGTGTVFDAINALRQRSDVIMTPHNAFNTEEAVAHKSEQSIQQLNSLLKNRRFIWTIPDGPS